MVRSIVIGGQGHVSDERVEQDPVGRRYPRVYTLCKHLTEVVRRASACNPRQVRTEDNGALTQCS